MEHKSVYESPLGSRYASREMLYLFSPDNKFITWRKLWVALAEAEKELGLPITDAQIASLKEHVNDIDYDAARAYEERVRHDVMAHVRAYADQCDCNAGAILHLGATSCYLTDNTDALILHDALKLIRGKLLEALRRLRAFALQYKDLPQLGLTHLQPAQPVTVGKRACLWMQDFLMDVEDLDHALSTVKLLGSKGTTGTQASFLDLFDGDGGKVLDLEKRIAKKMGLEAIYPVSGQTYPRKLDSRILSVLSGIAQSAYKFAQDIRLLQAFHECEEPFGAEQIGSSAMAYKRNPMRSERICSLSRHVMALEADTAMTAATQWFERTLDDSANRRLSLPEAFLATDAVLELVCNVTSGIMVYPKIIEKNLRENMPFMATENILMEAVKAGGDRQALHERIRVHSQEATKRVRVEGLDNDLLERVAGDPAFHLEKAHLEALTDPKQYTGRAAEQVAEFIGELIDPLLKGVPEIAVGDVRV